VPTYGVDAWLLFLTAAIAVLTVRIVLFAVKGGVPQPATWSDQEKVWGRQAAWTLGLCGLAAVLTAAYVASRVPWVENFPALLAHPPVAVAGRQPWHISTWSYLFGYPLGLLVFAAVLVDPWTATKLSFRTSREWSLRMLPILAIIFAVISIWQSIDALSAALP